MGEYVQIVSYPDPDYLDARNEHLWLLVGGGDHFEGAHAFYLGPDFDIEGNDLAEQQVETAIKAVRSQGLIVDSEDALSALEGYRRLRHKNI